MALPAPIEMPSPLPVNAKSFDLTNPQLITPVGAGFIQTIDRGPQMWVAKYSTPPLSPERDQAFQAFLDALDGAANTFLAFDPRHARPFVGSGSTPWGSGAEVTSVDYANGTITLGSLSVGAVVTRTDYISYLDGNIWRLHRAKETKTADGSGVVSALKVTPRPLLASGTPALRQIRPCCAMKILSGVTKDDKVSDVGPTYSFNAVQFIDRSS